MAKKPQQQALPYSHSRRLIDAEEFGIFLSSRAYYNSIRKEIPDKDKPHTIEALLISLHDQEFIYHTRVDEKLDKEDQVIARKLTQLFFVL